MSPATRELCGHIRLRWLKDDVTALCAGTNGREVVLKRVDCDCLLDGELHPEIRERLARIRELAHGQVATLIAVERDTQRNVYSVWQYIGGTPILAWLCEPGRELSAAARMLRELVLAVESLHDQGIVHGALHDGNIIVDADGRVRLLDLSPLLFDDPRDDVAAICALITEAITRRGEQETPLGKALLAQIQCGGELRHLSSTISRLIQENDAVRRPATADHEESRVRREALRWAGICALIALLLAAWFWWNASSRIARPQQAPPEALEAR